MTVAYLVLAAAAATSANAPDDLAVRAVHNFGACIVREAPTGATERLLEMDFRSEDYQRKIRAMAKGHDRCIVGGWQLGSSQVLIAGAIAEAALESKVKMAELPQRLAFDPARAVIKARSPMETMALCTALEAPQATALLLSTEPATKEESAAIGAIAPVLTECLRKDMKLSLNRPALRSLLALAAWRIVSTPKAAAQ